MSEANERKREWRFYVSDMIGFCERVLDYTAGLDRASFVASAMTYDAVLRNLELIGEAATHIPRSGSRRPSPDSLARDRWSAQSSRPTATC